MTNHVPEPNPSVESDRSNVFGKHQANVQIGRKSTKRTKVAPNLGGRIGGRSRRYREGPTPGEWTAGGQALRG